MNVNVCNCYRRKKKKQLSRPSNQTFILNFLFLILFLTQSFMFSTLPLSSCIYIYSIRRAKYNWIRLQPQFHKTFLVMFRFVSLYCKFFHFFFSISHHFPEYVCFLIFLLFRDGISRGTKVKFMKFK